ncbi:MAG TPA: CBS domain-containing protein [Terriglobales bacterium]|nr:CBS domain-containing protein [Terriglobales bacterium]
MAESLKATTLVNAIMTQNPVTLDRNETLDIAESIMNLGRIRHMPVVDDGILVGIVSQRDLFRSALVTALGFGRKVTSALIKTIKVKEIMTEQVITISPETSIKAAARLMMEKRSAAFPWCKVRD